MHLLTLGPEVSIENITATARLDTALSQRRPIRTNIEPSFRIPVGKGVVSPLTLVA